MMLKNITNQMQKKIRTLYCNRTLPFSKYWILFFLSILILARLYVFDSHPIVISFDAEAEKEVYYQVFYTQNAFDEFSGSNVITHKASAGENHIEITLPTEKIAKFRLDLGSAPGKIQLKNIKVKGFNSIAINDISLLKLNQLKVSSDRKGEFYFYSDQGDPYFVYNKILDLSTAFIDWLPTLLWGILLGAFLCNLAKRWHKFWASHQRSFYISKEQTIILFKQIDFKGTLLISLFLLLYSLKFIQPNLVAPISSFNRIIGQGVINDYDVNSIIKNFYIFFLLCSILYTVTSLVFTLIIRYLSTLENPEKIKDDLDNWCIVGICYALFCYVVGENLSNNAILSGVLNLILTVMICKIVLYLLNRDINLHNFNLYVYISLCLSIYFSFSGISDADIMSISIKCIITVSLILYLFQQLLKCISSISNFNLTKSLLLCTPLLTSLVIETFYILNRYEIFITDFRTSYNTFMAILLVIALTDDIKNKSLFYVTQLYPIVVMGFAALSFQMPFIKNVGAHLFESANSSIFISSLLDYGELPIFHHFGAHMLQSIMSGIVYGVINNDSYGAIFSPYGLYLYIPLIIILFYNITLKVTQNRDLSILVSLFFPITNNIIRPFFAIGLLIIPPVYKYIKNNSYTNAILIMISCVIIFFYRIDIGVAFIIAAGLALLWAADSKAYLYKLIITGFVVAITIALLYCLICISYDISPFERLQEFFYIANSNPNWARNSIFSSGDERNFNIFYLLLPVVIICSLIYLMLSSNSSYIDKTTKIILIILGVAYIINFQRGIVRHSLQEHVLFATMWSGYLFVIYFFTSLYKTKKIFIPLIMVALITEGLFLNKPINVYSITTQIMQNTIQINNDIQAMEKYAKNEEVANRVKIPQSISLLKQELEKIMDTILEADETYLDFSNHSFLYSLLKKHSPVYVSQSPALLSGEASQQYFIDEISADINKISLALLPFENKCNSLTMDGILNNMRYYKVAEFIYQNYQPLFRNEQYVFWIKNDKHDNIKDKIKNLKDIKEIDILYNEKYRTYNLIDLAYLWGEFDKNNAIENKQLRHISPQKESKYIFESLTKDEKIKGNYILLKIDALYDDNATLYIGTEEKNKVSTFNFNIKTGIHTYLLRVSADSLWYFLDINEIEVWLNNKHKLLELNILEGD